MSKEIILDLSLLLPDIPHEQDRCVEELMESLRNQSGVEAVRLSDTDRSGGMPVLKVIYDSDVLSPTEIEQIARSKGTELCNRVGHLQLDVNGLQVERRLQSAADILEEHPDILDAEPTAEGRIAVEYNKMNLDGESVRQMLHQQETNSYRADKIRNGIIRFAGFVKSEIELVFSLLCGFFLALGWVLATFTAVTPMLPQMLYVLAYFFGGYYTTFDVIHSLRAFKFNIHLLMLVAAIGAAILGHWAEGALLLFLFSLGHALEHYAMGRARRAINALSELTPQEAVVRDGSELKTVSVDELKPGHVVLIKPGERFPADGFVLRGQSDVDQSPITGESIPVDKYAVSSAEIARRDRNSVAPECKIFAGTINGTGTLDVELTGTASDSTLARVVQMVQEAQVHQSPTQRFAEKFEKWFVPLILVLVAILHFAWVIIDEPFAASFYRAMAVMVAASPCALAISTPSAILSGIARAARIGILVKGGAPLEQLGALDAIAFDKTGTLTTGKPAVTEVIPSPESSENELLTVVVAVEQLIDHPLAHAVVEEGRNRLGDRQLPAASDTRSHSGKGVEASLENQRIRIGKPEWFQEDNEGGIPDAMKAEIDRLSRSGNTTMVVQQGDRFLGVIGLMDMPREGAREVVEKLKSLGIAEMIMISGDHQQVAEVIGSRVGIDRSFGGLLPEDKVTMLKELQQGGRKVGMVGDGVNDAPAMASSSVGIAMGAAGSDVALETADIALMADDLNRLPAAVGLSRYTRRIIKQNLWISLGMIAFLVPVTMFGFANMAVAVLLHEGSTLVVVLNALRLLGYNE